MVGLAISILQHPLLDWHGSVPTHNLSNIAPGLWIMLRGHPLDEQADGRERRIQKRGRT